VSPVVLATGEGALTALLAGSGIPVMCVPTPRFFSTSTRLGILFGGRTVFNPVAVLADCLLLAWAAIVYARALRRARAQVVHTGSIFAHLLGALAAPLAGARLIWHVQDIVSPRLGGGLVLPSFARLGARCADLAVCPSEAVAAGLRAHWPPAKRDRLRVVRNGLDLRPYDPALPAAGVRRELGFADEAFVVVHVGRLVPWKGQREFLEAARLVATERPEARFLVVGDVTVDGPAYRDALRRLVQRLGLQDRVVFTGWRRDVPVLLAAADVLVHSSVLPEPFGLVIVEAMAMERPVVTSRLGGPGEIVRDGHEGVLVDSRNPEEIAEALLRLAADPALRTCMGRAGRVRALGCFGAERFVREMAAMLHEAAWGC
jgi:glycosyltransferase involved in cell wall biosynthesis